MTLTETNTTATEPIDATGIIADLRVGGRPPVRPTDLDVRINGTASADYVVEVGTEDGSFFEVASPTSTTTVAESVSTPFDRLRVRVTTAATAGATGDVVVGAKPE